MEKQTIIAVLLIITIVLSVSSIAITWNTKDIKTQIAPETQSGNVQLTIEQAPRQLISLEIFKV
ncbi:MAG: hypothetical protein QT05_C0015G0006 [archaeon GW2011_AR13]|nr:MAG: hypothetical protein QT05_C0015G0006 [archaeon GW2011_AR13]